MMNETQDMQHQLLIEENPLYTDTHRLFVRVMLSHRILTMEKASQFFNQVAALTKHQSGKRKHQMYSSCTLTAFCMTALHEAIPVINNELSEINMLLKETKDEWSGDSMLVMINTTEDPYVEKMTPYTPKELEYYRHLVWLYRDIRCNEYVQRLLVYR